MKPRNLVCGSKIVEKRESDVVLKELWGYRRSSLVELNAEESRSGVAAGRLVVIDVKVDRDLRIDVLEGEEWYIEDEAPKSSLSIELSSRVFFEVVELSHKVEVSGVVHAGHFPHPEKASARASLPQQHN